MGQSENAWPVERWVEGEQRQDAREGNTEKRTRVGLPCPYMWLLLDAEPGGGVLGKDLAQTYVAAKRLDRLVSSLFHHHKFADPVHRGLGDATGPERVSSDGLGLHPCARYRPLQNGAHGVLVETALGQAPMTIDSAEDGSFLDRGLTDPDTQGPHRTSSSMLAKRNSQLAARTLLVGLRCGHVDDHALLTEGEFVNLDAREFGSSEAAGEAYQSECPVAQTKQIVRTSFHDPANVRGEKRIFSFLCGSEGSADSFQCFSDHHVTSGGGRVGETGRLMGLGDGCEPAGDEIGR